MWGTVLTWLVSFTIVKVVTLFGIGLVTFASYQAAMSAFETSMVNAFGNMPADALAYLSMSGFVDGFGILLGALTVRAALVFAPRIGNILGSV